MLLFHPSMPASYQHLSADERQQLMMRWNAWYDALSVDGKAVEGQPLDVESRLVSGCGGRYVIDRPFAEAKETIAGYVKLMVSGVDEATEIAQRHPGLEYGVEIEVRAMTQECPLGVKHHSAAPLRPLPSRKLVQSPAVPQRN